MNGSIEALPSLSGVLVSESSIEGTLTITSSLEGIIASDEQSLEGSVTVWSVPYEGEYEVTPLARQEVVLETHDAYLKDNIIINAIPIYETSNDSDGTTVYIGG